MVFLLLAANIMGGEMVFAQMFVEPFACSDLSKEQVWSRLRQLFREEG